MLQHEEVEYWEDGFEVTIDKHKEIQDLYTLYLWSGEFTPYQELIRRLKTESTSDSSLYNIAKYINWLHKDSE